MTKNIINNNSKSNLKILKCDVGIFTERTFSKHVKYGEWKSSKYAYLLKILGNMCIYWFRIFTVTYIFCSVKQVYKLVCVGSALKFDMSLLNLPRIQWASASLVSTYVWIPYVAILRASPDETLDVQWHTKLQRANFS